MGYADNNLVPGETLIYKTRHHWAVLLGPALVAVLLFAAGVGLLVGLYAEKNGKAAQGANNSAATEGMTAAGAILLVAAIATFAYGLAKRNATEMAVTNRRVLIKTGMASRRTLDLMLSRVESIGVEETFLGRMLGYGSVIVRGTGGTPEPFVMIAHPQEFRRNVQEQIGGQ